MLKQNFEPEISPVLVPKSKKTKVKPVVTAREKSINLKSKASNLFKKRVKPKAQKEVRTNAGGGNVSGGFTFGKNQNLASLPFWIISGLVLILIIRPFGFLSGMFGGKKRKR